MITTTYMGVTEKRAVDELVSLGAEVRVAFDARTTKLHAKAWLLERASGLTTAFVGSSNLSHSALFDGLEWNVRLSSMDAAHVIDRVRMTFESHWASEHFEPYDPAVNGDELERALAARPPLARGELDDLVRGPRRAAVPTPAANAGALTVERERHDRHRNLVVAATGTGKTVVAALDYRQLVERHGGPVAAVRRASRGDPPAVAGDLPSGAAQGAFGEIHGGGRIAQRTARLRDGPVAAGARLSRSPRTPSTSSSSTSSITPRRRPTTGCSNHLSPRELLGLTATPERLDGQDVTEWFDHRIAVELRLWEAIDQGFLVPFQYFGVADGTDLSQVTWRRGGYVLEELSNLLTNDDLASAKLLEAV